MEIYRETERPPLTPENCVLSVETVYRIIDGRFAPSQDVLYYIDFVKSAILEHLDSGELDEQTKKLLGDTMILVNILQAQFPAIPETSENRSGIVGQTLTKDELGN